MKELPGRLDVVKATAAKQQSHRSTQRSDATVAFHQNIHVPLCQEKSVPKSMKRLQ